MEINSSIQFSRLSNVFILHNMNNMAYKYYNTKICSVAF